MKRAPLLVCCVLALAAGAACAQVRSFLQIPGLPGESVNEGRKDWIDLLSVSVGVTDRVCNGVLLTKNLDMSSPLLSGAALNGGAYPRMTIEAVRGIDGRPETFLTYRLDNVTVAAVQATTTTSAPALESVQLAPATITMEYTPPSTGGGGKPVSFTLTCLKR